MCCYEINKLIFGSEEQSEGPSLHVMTRYINIISACCMHTLHPKYPANVKAVATLSGFVQRHC